MPDPIINPEAPKPPEPVAKPDDPLAGKTPEELIAMVRDTNLRTEALAADNELLNTAYTTLASQAIAASHRSFTPDPPAPPVVAPDREEDPEGWVNHVVEQRISEALRATVAPLVDQFRNDRASLFSSTVANEIRAMRDDKRYPGFVEIEDKVMEFAKNFPAEALAKPGSLAECYYRVFGMEQAKNAEKNALREQTSLEIGGRMTHTPQPDIENKLTDRETVAAVRAGLDAKQFNALKGGGRMDIDEWTRLNAKEKTA
jgi:hypothetical protein